jgi:hypothetical protein
VPAENPIDDDPIIRRIAAVRPPIREDDLSPDSPHARAMAERVLAGSTSTTSPSSRRRWARPRWVLAPVGLALAPVAAAIVLLLAGTFSGPDSSGTQPAAAAVIRDAIHALATSGAIFVEDQTYVSGPSVHGHPYTIDHVLETPTGSGSQSVLTTYSDPKALHQNPAQTGWAYGDGTQEIYSRATNTIYATSIWGPYLHPGPRRGTYVYRYAKGATLYTTRAVTVTAGQARALRAGRVAIVPVGDTGRFKVRNPGNFPGYAQVVQDEIRDHMLHYVGRRTVDGRAALELAGTTNGGRSGDAHIYLDPTTHLPFEEVDQPGTTHQQVIHVRLRKLPITRKTERLVSLHALHPTARIDRSHQDYLRAAHGTQIYDG